MPLLKRGLRTFQFLKSPERPKDIFHRVYRMSVVVSGSVISFPPMMFMDFNPVQDVIGDLGDMYRIEGITDTVNDRMMIVGLKIEKDAPADFVEHIYALVKNVIDK